MDQRQSGSDFNHQLAMNTVSSNSSSFVNSSGAGSNSHTLVIDPNGEVSQSSKTIFVPGASVSSGSSSASSSHQGDSVMTSATGAESQTTDDQTTDDQTTSSKKKTSQ